MSEAFSFEGDEVTDFTAQLPATMLEAPEAYQRGTLLTLQVQVRVRSVRIEEDRKGNLSRKHVLALEDCQITDVLTPAMRAQLLEQAAAIEAQTPNVVHEEPSFEDVPLPLAEADVVTIDADDVELDVIDVVGPVESVASQGQVYNFVAPDQTRGLPADDDDDPEHAWMDEDAVDELKVVVGF